MNALQETIEYMKTLALTLFTAANLKSIIAIMFIIYSFLFDVNQGAALLGLFVLIIMDFVTAIVAAKITGVPITSAEIRHSAAKILAYYAMIAGAHIVEKGVVILDGYIDEAVLGYLLATELLSLLENFGIMGYNTPKKLLNQLKRYVDKN